MARGRKTRRERLEHLKNQLSKKKEQRLKIDEEIKNIEQQIEELENYFILKETEKLHNLLAKKGLTLEDLTKAMEKELFPLDTLDSDSN